MRGHPVTVVSESTPVAQQYASHRALQHAPSQQLPPLLLLPEPAMYNVLSSYCGCNQPSCAAVTAAISKGRQVPATRDYAATRGRDATLSWSTPPQARLLSLDEREYDWDNMCCGIAGGVIARSEQITCSRAVNHARERCVARVFQTL